ncbi:uncharacterized protein [Epargyreus clarus]|uniref:uncharacterized protein n=1 Tax=Epargyreus clarus TaxID=520877 RepID=UPI003C2B0883
MDTDTYQTTYFRNSDESRQNDTWRHHCGCIRTSDKLKQILKSFPTTPPPSPSHYEFPNTSLNNTCISAYCTGVHKPLPVIVVTDQTPKTIPAVTSAEDVPKTVKSNDTSKSWRMVGELVQLLQLSVTATALALYYLIYCYMQLVYYTLRSALYFHNADGPMKVTIGVVTVTSVIVGFNLIIRMERLIGIFH